VRHYRVGGGEIETEFGSLKVPRQCPLVLLRFVSAPPHVDLARAAKKSVGSRVTVPQLLDSKAEVPLQRRISQHASATIGFQPSLRISSWGLDLFPRFRLFGEPGTCEFIYSLQWFFLYSITKSRRYLAVALQTGGLDTVAPRKPKWHFLT
jgi:hypothetical protein